MKPVQCIFACAFERMFHRSSAFIHGHVHYFIMMYSLWQQFRDLLPADHRKISSPVSFGPVNTPQVCVWLGFPRVTATHLLIKGLILPSFYQ